MNTHKKRKTGKILLTVLLILGITVLSGRKLVEIYQNVSFYWTERTEAELKVKKFSEEQGIPYRKYPKSLIELLERNPETEEFVLNYPFRQDMEPELNRFDPGDVPLFIQWDPHWGYEKYGADLIGITGCGPTCLAMAGYYLRQDPRFTPDQVAKFAEDNGYYVAGSGSSWTLISEGGVKLGLDVTEIPLVKKRIVDNLNVGNPVICSMRAGDFTTSGHYIVLVGMEDGLFRVNDPNSYENSARLWSYEQLEGQIRNLWVIR